uniref:Reverse transcriptase domain-containing protein n=1 Tax=Acrobeloides nanus TaxID=290746 RepID=A0A914E9U9_9BILA
MLNPYMGISEIKVDIQEYDNWFVALHNYFVACVYPSLYLVLCAAIIIKIKSSGASDTIVTHQQKQIIIQSIIISAVLATIAVAYMYMQYFTVPPWFFIAAHFMWQAAHGISVFTYIFVNRTMRSEVIQLIKNLKNMCKREVALGLSYPLRWNAENVYDGASVTSARMRQEPNQEGVEFRQPGDYGEPQMDQGGVVFRFPGDYMEPQNQEGVEFRRPGGCREPQSRQQTHRAKASGSANRIGPIRTRPLSLSQSINRSHASSEEVGPPRTPRLVGAFSEETTAYPSQNSSLSLDDGRVGTKKLSVKLTARSGTCKPWTATEKYHLRELMSKHQRSNAGLMQWVQIHREWDLLRSRGIDLHERSKAGLIGQYNVLKKQSVPQSATVDNGINQAPGNPMGDPGPDEPPNDSGPSEPPGDPDPNAPSVTTDSQDRTSKKFKRKFYRYFAEAYGKFWRRPLKRPFKQAPDQVIDWASQLIEKTMSQGAMQIDKLSALVYAAGQAINWYMDTFVDEMRHDNAAERIRDLKRRIKILESEVRWIGDELTRRDKCLPRTKQQRRCYTQLVRKYKTKRTAQLKALKHDLTIKLQSSRRNLVTDLEFLEVRQLRRLSPKYAYVCKGEQENAEVPVDATRTYWAGIIGEKREFQATDELKQWARDVKNRKVQLPRLHDAEHKAYFDAVCKKARPWKAAGPDGIQNYWWKHIPAARVNLFGWILKVHNGEAALPGWLSSGRIVLLYKSGERNDPSNYRPISCLNNCYKLLTGMLTRWMDRYFDASGTLPAEQLALKSGVWGCTQAHILDRVLTTDAKQRKKDLSIAWVDFTKAFDSVSHRYIMWALKQIGIPHHLRYILKQLMGNWIVRYQGKMGGRIRYSQPLRVQNGVLQGDTLSPKLFVVAIAAISHWLNTNVTPYETSIGIREGIQVIQVRVNHLYYVDDLKQFTTSPSELSKALDGVSRLGKAIGLTINTKKCAQVHLRSRDQLSERSKRLDSIPLLGTSESYKYLGMEQNVHLSQHEVLDRLEAAVTKQAKAIWSSKRTFGQKVADTNATIMAKARYAYQNIVVGTGRFESTVKRANKLDSMIQCILKDNKAKQNASSVDRLKVDRTEGGLGLQTFAETLEHAVVYCWAYLAVKPELSDVWRIFSKLSDRNKRNVIGDVESIFESSLYGSANLLGRIKRDCERPMVWIDGVSYDHPTKTARKICGILHEMRQRVYLLNWNTRASAGKVLQNADLDRVRSLLWTGQGQVNSRVMSNILASQEGVILTKVLKYKNTPEADKFCRMKCHLIASSSEQHPQFEMVHHITSLCEHWRAGLGLKRHNATARVLYNFLGRKAGMVFRSLSDTPDPVSENDAAAL